MKQINGKIDSCFGCPYYRTPSDDKVKLDWCYLAGKLIENISVMIYPIPVWCPLPDWIETEEKIA